MKRRDLEKRLSDYGWRFLRAGGRHDVWTDGEREEAVPRHREINEKLARAIFATSFQGANVRFEGHLTRDGRFWLAEIPLLDGMTQGRTRAEALEMIGDWLETMVDRKGFRARVFSTGKNTFEVSGSNAAAMTALLLRRRREASGSSLREVASRLGASSRNAYARYERGDAVPTLDKLDALLKAASPEGDFVIRGSSANSRQ